MGTDLKRQFATLHQPPRNADTPPSLASRILPQRVGAPARIAMSPARRRTRITARTVHTRWAEWTRRPATSQAEKPASGAPSRAPPTHHSRRCPNFPLALPAAISTSLKQFTNNAPRERHPSRGRRTCRYPRPTFTHSLQSAPAPPPLEPCPRLLANEECPHF